MPNTNADKIVDRLFRKEAGRMVAVLSRKFGLTNLDVAEDIVQDTLLTAMHSWRFGKLPDDPKAWLYRVARNKAIDFLRRNKAWLETDDVLIESLEEASWEHLFLDHEISDSVLRMMFVCCHPSLPLEGQLAFALRTVGGMTSREIASAFLTTEETIQKRIYRVREKIKAERITLEVPVSTSLGPRLQSVLHVLYLLFSEGYHSSVSETTVRSELCFEAMRLCYLLATNPLTDRPLTNALLSLMCFQASRIDSRVDISGNLVTLMRQDRSKWDRDLIAKGMLYLDRAAETTQLSMYHLEAGIAAIHAAAPSFETTDWRSVYHLYEILYANHPSPIIALNKAVASSYAISANAALRELEQIRGMEKSSLYHASLGQVFSDLKRHDEAKRHFTMASELTSSSREKRFFQSRIAECSC